MSTPQAAGDQLTPGRAANFLYLVITGLSFCFYPFLRCDFGVRAFHYSGPTAVILMFLYAAFARCPELLSLMGWWFALVLYHRVMAIARELKGESGHSFYEGDWWVARWCGFSKENAAKVIWEPFVVASAAAFVCDYSTSMAKFMFLGCAAMIAKRLIDTGIQVASVRAMRDKVIELRARADRFRNGSS